MIHRYALLFFVSVLPSCAVLAEPFSLEIPASTDMQKMSFLIALSDTSNQNLLKFADLLGKLLARPECQKTGFNISIKQFSEKPTLQIVKKYSGIFDLALFLSNPLDEQLEWRLFDVRRANMLKGGKSTVHQEMREHQVEHLADEIVNILTAQQSFYTTRIAFCRQIRSDEYCYKQLCVMAPYAASSFWPSESSISVLAQAYNIFAPRWNKDPYMPLVFYSQSTKSNVCLISSNLRKQRRIVSNLTGINMQPSFSRDGDQVVYCVSQNGKTELYRYSISGLEGQSGVRPFICNGGNNFAPQVCDNGDVIFCSDVFVNRPHICWYHAATGTIEDITHDGYAVCPTLCESSGLLAYCKKVGGNTQIFIYNRTTNQHEQVTHDHSNKEECTWSPCGNYLAFSVDTGKNSRIAIWNRKTREQIFLTSASENCTYPCWSEQYKVPLRICTT